MIPLRVIGIGSPFGDDQAGWEVVKILQQQANLLKFRSQSLDLLCYDRPGVHLLDLMQVATTVFLIDAIKLGLPIGSISQFQNSEIEAISENLLSSHSIGIAQVMKLGKALSLLPKQVILYGIEIDNIQFKFKLSSTIKRAVKKLAIQLSQEIVRVIES